MVTLDKVDQSSPRIDSRVKRHANRDVAIGTEITVDLDGIAVNNKIMSTAQKFPGSRKTSSTNMVAR